MTWHKNTTVQLCLFILFLMVGHLIVGCSPQKRLNRKVNRTERYAQKHGLTLTDTIRIVDIDTLITETVVHDTVTQLVEHDSVTVIQNEDVILKYVYIPETKEIWHEVTCIGDTVIQKEIHHVTDTKWKVVPQSKAEDWLRLLIFILIGGYVLRRLIQARKSP